MEKDSSFRRNLIIIGYCWAAIFIFVVGGVVGATLSPPAAPRSATLSPATTTASYPTCPRTWVSGVGWVAIVHARCDVNPPIVGRLARTTAVDAQGRALPKACIGIDLTTATAIPAGCDGTFGSTTTAITPPPTPVSTPAQCPARSIYTPQGCIGSNGNGSTTGSTSDTTAITPPPSPVGTPAQCQARHDYYTPQGCIGSQGNGSTTGNTGSTAITPPPAPAPVYGHVDCPDHEIYTTQGCVGELPSGTVAIPPRMYPPPPAKCIKTSATTWTCTPTRPVTG